MRALTRIGVAGLAAAATVAAMSAVSLIRPTTAAPDLDAYGRGDDVRMNQIQFMGAHNAYHREMQGVELEEALKIDPGLPGWSFYSHASIPDLLERQNVRHASRDVVHAGGKQSRLELVDAVARPQRHDDAQLR